MALQVSAARPLGGGGRRADAPARRRGQPAVALAATAIALALAAVPISETAHVVTSPSADRPWAQTAALPADWPGEAATSYRGLLPEAHAQVGQNWAPGPCKPGILHHYQDNAGNNRPITVYFTTRDGTYGIGESIDIRVNATAGIGGGSVHQVLSNTVLVMETGEVDRNAVFSLGGNLQTTLYYVTYRYTVQENDTSTDLGYASRTALHWSGLNTADTIQTGGSIGFNCELPVKGSPNSLSGRSDIIIDGIRPVLDSVTARVANGTYGAGRDLSFNARFSEPVFVVQGQEPKLVLDFDGTYRNATYASGNETRSLVFEYSVQDGDQTSRLDYNATNALLGSVKDIARNDVNWTRVAAPGEPGSLGRTSEIATETVQPEVASVSSISPDRTYKFGDTIRINVTFTEPVVVVTTGGTPTLPLNTAGGTAGVASYHSGSGSASLEFRYTVGTDHETANLDQGSALLLNDGTIKDVPGNNADLDLSGLAGADRLASPGLSVDGKMPAVTGVASPNASRTYGPGDRISIAVTFDEDVTVTGMPRILLETGAADKYAVHGAGQTSAARTHAFVYTVASGDVSADLVYHSDAMIDLNSGTIEDEAGNAANRALPTPVPGSLLSGPANRLVVDGRAPEVSSVASPNASRTYGPGDRIRIAVTFNEDVAVTGEPRIKLETGTTDRYANYTASASSAAVLAFTYMVGTGDVSGDLDYHADAVIDLNGGTIRDPSGNAANRALPAPGADGLLSAPGDMLVVDGRAPEVSSVASPNASRTYGPGDRIRIAVTFNEDVAVTGEPRIKLETGTTDRYANYTASASSAAVLAFTYMVGTGDVSADLDYHSDAVIDLNGGTIMDPAGNDARLMLPAPGADGLLSAPGDMLVVDGRAPEVSSVASPNASRTYGPGDRIRIAVTFNEDVVVTGEPRIKLATGSTERYANYTASASSAAVLAFTYQVGSGDVSADLDYHSDAVIDLNSGTIRDTVGNNARLTLPAPGTDGLLSGQANRLVVDGVRPGVVSVSSPNGTDTYYPNDLIHVHVRFNETVTAAGAPFVELNATGGDPARATYSSGNRSNTLTFVYSVGSNNVAETLDYDGAGALKLGGGSIADLAGNPARLALPGPGAPGSDLAASRIKVVGDIPSVSRVSSPDADGAYGTGARINVTVTFSEAVSVDGSAPPPYIALNAGEGARATHMPGAGSGGAGENLSFAYVVRPGDNTDLLAHMGPLMGAGAIANVDGEPVHTTLPSPGLPTSLSGSSAIRIDTAAPAVDRVWSPNRTGTYTAGDAIRIVVVFSENVTVAAAAGGVAPTLTLETGVTDRQAAYESGSGTRALTFAYTVSAGDDSGGRPLDYAGTSALSLNGGAIRDVAGNAAVLALPDTGSAGSLAGSGIAVDAAPPYVERIASTNAAGTYGAGENIGINVVFTEAVAWPPEAAAPSLTLDAGGDSPAVAAYTSGNGTATLSFSYEVRIGDRTDDLSYNGTSALSAAGIADLAGNPANLTLPAPGTAGSLSASSSIMLLGLAGPVAATADASFTGPNTVRIEYDRRLGAPADYTGPAYGAITIGEGDAATTAQPVAGGESGLGTSVHTVRFGGDGVGPGQNGSIALNTDLVFAVGSARYEFTADSIDIAAGEDARTLSPRGGPPVVAIESDGFVRAVNATAAGDSARPAVNVTGLAALPDSGGRVAVIASFAEVSFPPGATVSNVPSGGLIALYVSERPTAAAVAAAFGATGASGIEVQRVVEVGGNENGTRIAFSQPVRILLAGQANGSAFYLGANGTVVPIVDACAADDTDMVHSQYRELGRTGECEIDSGADKIIYTYHLTPFGTARGPGGGPVMPACSIGLEPDEIKFGELRAGVQSDPVNQTVSRAGSMRLSEVSISAGDWKVEGAATVVMPANSTSVLPGGAGGQWTPMNGEVGLPLAGGQADLQFRLAVPPGTAPVAETLQIVTYTAS